MGARLFPLVLLLLLSPASALADEPTPAVTEKPRGEIRAAATLSGGATLWRGDGVGYGGLGLGLRLFGVVMPYVDVRLGYGAVDQRQLTFLSLGVEGGYAVTDAVYPRLRAGFVHQHEESLAAVAEEPFGAVLGIGKGIRHRAGVALGLGVDFTILRRPKLRLTAGPEVTTAFLGYSSGPSVYVIVAGNLAIQAPIF